MQACKLSDYELGEVLGVGTVGTIYAGKHRSSGERVAIKKLHPTVSQDKNICARFEREMLILSRLSHPNIIGYHGGGEEDGQLFYVMELVTGGTVKDLLERLHTFRWTVVVELARQICSALQHAHNHGVIHRDLKPGNLFLTRDGGLKLGDFGIARDLHNSELTSSGMTVGTHAYMAPEQITGDHSISGKADLYALGCCLYEMLVGQKVFAGENFAQLFEQHLRSQPQHVRDLMADCPEELDRIVFELLAKKPEDRPFNARSVQAVMLRLGETYDADVGTLSGDAEDTSKDVAAETATLRGRQLLIDQINSEVLPHHSVEVSWGKLAAILLGIGAMIAIAAMA